MAELPKTQTDQYIDPSSDSEDTSIFNRLRRFSKSKIGKATMIAATAAAVLVPASVTAEKIVDRVGASQEQVDETPPAPEAVHEAVDASIDRLADCIVESVQTGSGKHIAIEGVSYAPLAIDLNLTYNPAATEKREAFKDGPDNLLQIDTDLVVNFTPAHPADGDRTEQKLPQLTLDKDGTNPSYTQGALGNQLQDDPSRVSTTVYSPRAVEGDRLTLGVATHAASARYNEERSAYQPCGWAEFTQGKWEVHLPPTQQERAQIEQDAAKLRDLYSQVSVQDVNSTDERLGSTPLLNHSEERRKLLIKLDIENDPEQQELVDRYSNHKNPWMSVESVISAGVRRVEQPDILAPIETGSLRFQPGEVAFEDTLRQDPHKPVEITLVPRDPSENSTMELAVVTRVASPFLDESESVESTRPVGQLTYRDGYWQQSPR